MSEDVKKTEEKEDEAKEESKEKSIAETLSQIETVITKFDTSKLEKSLSEISERVKALETLNTVKQKNEDSEEKKEEDKSKAMEEPTDLPSKPKVQAEDDIGDKTKVPDTYQSNSQQASVGDSDPQNSKGEDKGGLAMQEKSEDVKKSDAKSIEIEKTDVITTQRPPATYENAGDILKSAGGFDANPVLKACRETPYDRLGEVVGRKIMKGEFGAPSYDEVARW